MVETVYKGVLEMQQSLSDPKSWKRWQFVLKKVKSSGTASLEYYKEAKKDTMKQNPKGVLNLLSNYSVQIVGAAAMRKFVFEVRTLEQTFRLAAETRELMDEWVYFMQVQTQANHIVSPTAKVFDVTPERTEALLRIGARDVCRLYIETTEIILALASTGVLLARWPLQCLRRYGCDQGVFSFEAGRKAPLGEGKYSFRSEEDALLFDTLEHMVKSRASSLPRPNPSTQRLSQLLMDPSTQRQPQPLLNPSTSNLDRTSDDDEHQYNTLQFFRGPPGLVQSPANPSTSSEAGYSQLGTRAMPPPAEALNEYHHISTGMVANEEYDQIAERIKEMDLDSEYAYAYTKPSIKPASQPPPVPRHGPPKKSSAGTYETATHMQLNQHQAEASATENSAIQRPTAAVPNTSSYETAVIPKDTEV